VKSPRTRYAKTADGVNIAYSVTGDGPDLAYLPGKWGDVELWWEGPSAPFFSRLAESFRLILHDPRGSGMSERDRVADLETRASDFLVVGDAIGSESSAFFAVTVGGHMPILLGSTAPQRVTALAWYLPYARFRSSKSHPFGLAPKRYEQVMADLEDTWGIPSIRGVS
jgi:pimeloyl-ACP methyl ester carboxylesterase